MGLRTRFWLRRLASMVVVLFVTSVLVFALLRLVPGDPARLLAGPQASPEDLARMRDRLGLDDPLPLQYFTWLGNAVRGDFGASIVNGLPVFPQVLSAFWASLQLAITGMLLAVVVGVPLGVLAARRPGGTLDHLSTSFAVVGISVPIFFVGVLLISMFSVRLGWLPATGKEGLSSFVLPTATIAIYEAAYVIRMTRATVRGVLEEPYIAAAKAKGISAPRLYGAHALRNAAIPISTIVVIQFGYLLGGAALTETVFVWPGLGHELVNALASRDYAMVQGAVVVIAVAMLIVYLLADLLYTYLDPRIRL